MRFWIGVVVIGGGMLLRVAPIAGAGPLGLIVSTLGLVVMSRHYIGQWFWPHTAVRCTLILGLFACVLLAGIAMVSSVPFDVVWHAAQATLGATGVTAAVTVWQRHRDHALSERIAQAALLGDRPLEPLIDEASRVPRPSIFAMTNALVIARRFDLIERLMRAHRVPFYETAAAYQLATSRFEQGDIDGAAAIAREHETAYDKHGPLTREEWRQLLARIEIARGHAHDVLEMPEACPIFHPLLQHKWKMIRVDAYVVTGDLERARAILQVESRQGLEILATRDRPLSTLAAELVEARKSTTSR